MKIKEFLRTVPGQILVAATALAIVDLGIIVGRKISENYHFDKMMEELGNDELDEEKPSASSAGAEEETAENPTDDSEE